MSCDRAVDAASFVHGGRKDARPYVSNGARKTRSPSSRRVQLQMKIDEYIDNMWIIRAVFVK
jgi:hypothetical protein